MKRLSLLFVLLCLSAASYAAKSGCLSCHKGIENIRDPNSAMLLSIKALGTQHGDPEGCVICHGGNPGATTKEAAHKGSPQSLIAAKGAQMFYRDPGSIWINKFTCSQAGCHQSYSERMEKSLMNTEAGKIQGNLHTWGIPEVQNYKVPWGNYDVKDEDGLSLALVPRHTRIICRP